MLRGVAALLALVVNMRVWCSGLFALPLLRLVLPLTAVRRVLDPWLNAVATNRIASNIARMRATQNTQRDVQGLKA